MQKQVKICSGNHENKRKSGNSRISRKPLRYRYGLYMIVFLTPILLYVNTFNHSYVYDDFNVLKENWVVKEGVSGIPLILQHSYRYALNLPKDNLYRPLSQVMFAIEWEVWPNNPFVSHIINVLLYALLCGLILFVLKLLFPEYPKGVVFLVSLLFMVHPIHTEVVSNIKSRDEILCMLGFIASLYFLIRWYKNESVLHLVFSVLCYGMALFSKETALAMFLIFPLTMFYMGFRKAKIVMGSLFYLIPLVFYLSVRLMVLGFDGDAPSVSLLDNFLVSHTGFLDRFPTVLMLLGKYLGLFVFPYTLVSDYSFNQIQSVGVSDLGFWISFILYISMFYYIVRNIFRKDPMVFGLLFYLISILIYSNLFVLIGSAFAERFLFIPSLGLSICVVFLSYKIIQRFKDNSPSWVGTVRYLVVLVFILLSVQTVLRSGEWKDPLTLAGTDVHKSPESARLHASYGFALRDYARTFQHRVASDSINRMALEHFTRAIRIYPQYSAAHAQAGLIHYVLQDAQQAMVHYRIALSLAPESAETWCNMGIIYVDRKDYDSAIIVYKKSISYNPRFVDSYLNLGSVMGQMGKYEESLPYFKTVLEYDPANLKALQMMSLSYTLLGNKPMAEYWKNQMISVQSKYQP